MIRRFLVGLAVVADVLTIISFANQYSFGSINIGRPQSFTSALIVGLALTYSWFIISWAIIRRYWLKTLYSKAGLEYHNRYFRMKRIRSEDDLSEIAGATVYPIGVGVWLILVSFLIWLISSYDIPQGNKIGWYICVICGTVVWAVLFSFLIKNVIVPLMPAMYADMFEI